MVNHKYSLEDFEVIKTHIPETEDWYMKADHKTVPGYEIYKLYKTPALLVWVSLGLLAKYNRPIAVETRKRTIEEVAEYLSVETGHKAADILKKLKS